MLLFVITGQDPVLALFTWLTQLGTLAIITLMALASFAVVAFFRRHRDLDANPLRTIVAPVVGGVAMAAVAVYAASQFGLLIGNPESPLRWILPALIVVAAAAGVVAAVSLKVDRRSSTPRWVATATSTCCPEPDLARTLKGASRPPQDETRVPACYECGPRRRVASP